MDAVFVRGIEFEGNHGYTAAERRSTRRFRVSLTLELPLGPAAARQPDTAPGDKLQVSAGVVGRGTQSTYRLIEALAGAIARAIQDLYPKVGVTVELDKLSPPCPGVPESSGVRISLPAR
jgi:dihydroneopterin aldolase